MSVETIHIWELGERVNVKLDADFLLTLNQEVKKQYGTKEAIHRVLRRRYALPFSTFKARLKTGYRYFLDLEIVLVLCDLLGISRYEMQRHIIAYKSRRGVNEIRYPILPLRVTPIVDMLIAHHIGDGTVVDPKKGRKPYFSYRQFDRQYMALYVQKIESVFGKIHYRKPYADVTRSYFPTVVSPLLFKLYDADTRSFLSTTARIPPVILAKGADSLLAFLLGMIIDEGTVDSTTIVIVLKNKPLVKDLAELCARLEYPVTVTERPRGKYAEYGYLFIRKEGVKRLWKDYLVLREKYPEVELGRKGEQIAASLALQERPIRNTAGNDHIIVSLLSQESLTVNQLARTLKMTRQGVRHHLQKLALAGRIERKRNGDGEYLYAVRNFK